MCRSFFFNVNWYSREITGKLAAVANVDDAYLTMAEVVSLLEKDHTWDRVSTAEVGDSIAGAWGVS